MQTVVNDIVDARMKANAGFKVQPYPQKIAQIP